jgi:hypothetical protein
MLETLPAAFTLADARQAGIRKDQVYQALDTGDIERIGRGTFVRADMSDPALASLAAATARQPKAVMCLTSALVVHGLSDTIPMETDIALPRGTRHPAGFEHTRWHSFDPATFDLGRQPLDGQAGLSCYSPERSIIDVYRLAHQEGQEVAVEALKRWLRGRGNYPARLLDLAASFPKAYPAIRHALEILT